MSALEPKLSQKCLQESNPYSETEKWFCKFYRWVNLKLSIWHEFAVYQGQMPSQYGLPTPYIECAWTKTVPTKKYLQKSNPFSELKNGFAKFIGESTSSCRYGMCLQCTGGKCPRNMGSQLPILSEYELKQYPSVKRVHSAKVIWFRWFCQNKPLRVSYE